MAPMVEEEVDEHLKAVVQDLYEVQTCIHGYLGPQTRNVLIEKMHELTLSLKSLSASAPHLKTLVPPEIIAYVEDGRNPDIYTREFVESVQKMNMILKGKTESFADFRDIFADEIVTSGMASRQEVENVRKTRTEDMDVKAEEETQG